MISALHLLWIVPLAAFMGFIIGALLSSNKVQDAMQAELATLERENAEAEYYRNKWKVALEIKNNLRHKLKLAEKDMATLLDCCDICGHNNNPNCPGDDCETCGAGCPCKECRNSSSFVWKGNMETERRSGIDTGNGETQKGGGDRQGAAESVYSAQAGNGVREREA